MCKRLSYNTGEVIWHSGDNMLVLPSDKLHVAGQRGFTSRGSPSRSFFGAMACLSGKRKFVGFAATEPSTVLCLMRTNLRTLTQKIPTSMYKSLKPPSKC